MQAPGSLSKSQALTLESCYLFLRTLRPLLVSLGNELGGASRAQLDGQVNLALLNESRLVEAFPEIAEAEKRWERGGVQ
jgi:hypothetical protein